MSTIAGHSQNGWPLLGSAMAGPLPRLRDFQVPRSQVHVPLRDGSAGFVLVHMAHWWDEKLETLDNYRPTDDWGYAAPRPITSGGTTYSNHGSGTALDLNATKHPQGVAIARTFTDAQVRAIHRRLKLYGGVIRWGGDYQHSLPDGMHLELVAPLDQVEKLARKLMRTPRGRRILKANPGLAGVILS